MLVGVWIESIRIWFAGSCRFLAFIEVLDGSCPEKAIRCRHIAIESQASRSCCVSQWTLIWECIFFVQIITSALQLFFLKLKSLNVAIIELRTSFQLLLLLYLISELLSLNHLLVVEWVEGFFWNSRVYEVANLNIEVRGLDLLLWLPLS